MRDNSWMRDDICHWCGKTYKRQISDKRHRFCSGICKQAHHRVYKKYVTLQGSTRAADSVRTVTPKKKKHTPCNILRKVIY